MTRGQAVRLAQHALYTSGAAVDWDTAHLLLESVANALQAAYAAGCEDARQDSEDAPR